MDIKKALEKIDEMYDSALHTASEDDPRDQPCPTCGEEDVLTRLDVEKGYQCDDCADRAEGKNQYESKKPSLKDYFQQISEDSTSGMKPLPILDPKSQQIGAAVIKSNNPAIQKILKNLTPQDIQVVQTMAKTGTAGQTSTVTSGSGIQPMKEEIKEEPSDGGEFVMHKGKHEPGRVSSLGGQTLHGVTVKDVYTDKKEAQAHADAINNGRGYKPGDEKNPLYGGVLYQVSPRRGQVKEGERITESLGNHIRKYVNAVRSGNNEEASKILAIILRNHGPAAVKHAQTYTNRELKGAEQIDEISAEMMFKARNAAKAKGKDAQAKRFEKAITKKTWPDRKAKLAANLKKRQEMSGEAEQIDETLGNDIRKHVNAVKSGDTKGASEILDRIRQRHGPAAVKHAQTYTNRELKGAEQKGVAEGHADQQRKIFKKNGKPVGEVGIDRESSPGVGQWYMKCYLNGIDNAGYDSYEEAVAELKHCLKQGVAEGKLNEKWGTETKVAPSEKGKYSGKTKAELLKHYNKLKNSGPHKKGSKEYGTMRELAFAIRAKSGWGKVKEAERPSDQVDMGAGLGAGRSQTVLESNMKKTCEAAYHEGKSHGLGGQSYTCRYDEGTDEHHHYHRGFKEGLDECYGIDPMRGVVDETMAATVPGMANQTMKESHDSGKAQELRSIIENFMSMVNDMNLYGNVDIDRVVNALLKGNSVSKVIFDLIDWNITDGDGARPEDLKYHGLAREYAAMLDNLEMDIKHVLDQGIDEAIKELDFDSHGKVPSTVPGTECDMDEGALGALAGGALGARVGGFSGAMTGARLGSKLQDKITDLDEMNKTEYMKHMAKKTPGKTFNAFGQTFRDDEVLESDYTFESLDKQLNALLNESEQVTEGSAAKKVIIKGLKNWIKAAKEQGYSVEGPFNPGGLYQAYSQSGSHRGTFSSEDEPGPGSLWGNSKPGMSANSGTLFVKNLSESEHVTEGISVSISKGQQGGHDSVSVTATDNEADNLLAFIKHAGMGLFADEQKASDYGAPVAHDGHAEVEDHSSVLDIMKKMSNIEKHGDYEEEESSSEGCGCGQTPCGCAHLEEVESEDQMEFEVAEDATEVAMTNADENSEAAEDEALAHDDELKEWANNAMQKGTEEAFTTGDEFMLDTISSGLNKKKSTGQATIPVNAAQKDRLGYNESISDWKKLAGI